MLLSILSKAQKLKASENQATIAASQCLHRHQDAFSEVKQKFFHHVNRCSDDFDFAPGFHVTCEIIDVSSYISTQNDDLEI